MGIKKSLLTLAGAALMSATAMAAHAGIIVNFEYRFVDAGSRLAVFGCAEYSPGAQVMNWSAALLKGWT